MDINFDEDAPVPIQFLNKQPLRRPFKTSLQTSNDPSEFMARKHDVQNGHKVHLTKSQILESQSFLKETTQLNKSNYSNRLSSTLPKTSTFLESTLNTCVNFSQVKTIKEHFEKSFLNYYLFTIFGIIVLELIYANLYPETNAPHHQISTYFQFFRITQNALYLYLIWFTEYYQSDIIELIRKFLRMDIICIFLFSLLLCNDYIIIQTLDPLDSQIYDEREVLHYHLFSYICLFYMFYYQLQNIGKSFEDMSSNISFKREIKLEFLNEVKFFILLYCGSVVWLTYYTGMETEGFYLKLIQSENILDFLRVYCSIISYQKILVLITKNVMLKNAQNLIRQSQNKINSVQFLHGLLQQVDMTLLDRIIIDKILNYLLQNESIVYLFHFTQKYQTPNQNSQMNFLRDLISSAQLPVNRIKRNLSSQIYETEKKFEKIDVILGLKTYIFHNNQLRGFILSSQQDVSALKKLIIIIENSFLKLKHIDNLEYYIEDLKIFLDNVQRIKTDMDRLLATFNESKIGFKISFKIFQQYEEFQKILEEFLGTVYPVIYKINYENY